MRATYCALAVARMLCLDMPELLEASAAVDYVARCQVGEGGGRAAWQVAQQVLELVSGAWEKQAHDAGCSWSERQPGIEALRCVCGAAVWCFCAYRGAEVLGAPMLVRLVSCHCI